MAARLSLALLLWLSSIDCAEAELQIEGDQSALQFVRDVQESNLAAYPRGSAKFRTVRVTGLVNDRKKHTQQRETCDGTVIWDGDRSYWDVRSFRETRGDGGDWTLRQRPSSRRQILTPTVQYGFAYESDPPRASRVFFDLQRRDATNGVIPREAWYSEKIPYIKTTWATRLDPARNQKSERMIIERPDDDLIVVKTIYGRIPPLTIRCSLAVGGNVISTEQPYWHDAPPNYYRFGERNSYEWLAMPDGRYRLKRAERLTGPPGEEPKNSFTLEILEFDPDPRIPQNRFTFESFNIPDGTIILEEKDGVLKETVKGKPRETKSQDVLDRLAEKAAKEGFARPKP